MTILLELLKLFNNMNYLYKNNLTYNYKVYIFIIMNEYIFDETNRSIENRAIFIQYVKDNFLIKDSAMYFINIKLVNNIYFSGVNIYKHYFILHLLNKQCNKNNIMQMLDNNFLKDLAFLTIEFNNYDSLTTKADFDTIDNLSKLDTIMKLL